MHELPVPPVENYVENGLLRRRRRLAYRTVELTTPLTEEANSSITDARPRVKKSVSKRA